MATEEKNELSELTTEVTSFIERAAPVLDKTAKLDASLGEKLPGVVNKLVELNIIDGTMKEAKLQQFNEDPSLVCDLLLKVASRIAAPTSLGGPGDISAAPASQNAEDAFVQRVLGSVRRV